MSNWAVLSGNLPQVLANEVSDAIHRALEKGMEPDEAASVVVAVATDYGRSYYGPGYCNKLAKVIRRQATRPLPQDFAG